jgi:hypothetical protein
VATSRARPRNAQAVGPVRGDFEVDDRVAAGQVLDGRDLESAQADRGGNLFSRCVDVDEFAKPRHY